MVAWKDMQNYEDARLAQNQASAQGWSTLEQPTYRGAGHMERPPDPSENYGVLSYLADLLGAHYKTQSEMGQQSQGEIGQWLASGGQGPMQSPESRDWMTNQAMGLAMGTVGPSAFGAKELAMRGGAKAGQLSRQSKSRWGDQSTGLEDALQELMASQERGGTPVPMRPMEGLTRDFEFGQAKPAANPNIDAVSRQMRERNIINRAAETTQPERSQSALDKMYAESPAMRDTRYRNFVLREGGNNYQHPMPHPMSDFEASARGQHGFNPDAWYSPQNILSALGSGLKGGAQAVVEDSPQIQALLAKLPAMPQIPGRAKAVMTEHPFGIAGGAAAGAAGLGMSQVPGSFSVAPPEYITDPEGANARARQSLADRALQAGSALKQRAQQPWWGVTPEDIQAAVEFFDQATRNPFRRS